MTDATTDFCVRSDPMPDGTYSVSIEVGDDVAFALDRARALDYAAACHAKATQADHATAVLRLLIEQLAMPHDMAGQFAAKDLRPDFSPHDDAATEPMRYAVAVGRAKHPRPDAGQYIPRIMVACGETDLGWIGPEQLREHAGGVLDCLVAAQLDTGLMRELVDVIGVSEDRARAIVSDLAEYAPQPGDLP